MRKSVIVTGAAGSLGSAVCHTLLAQSYRVYGTMLPTQSVAELENQEHFIRKELDATNEEACQQLVDEVQGEIRLAALIVGGFAVGGLMETHQEDLHKMIRMNFETAFYMSKALFPRLKEQQDGGRIVMIGAKPAIDPANGTFGYAYTLSKTLVHHLAEMLNAEGKDHHVITSVIVPSVIDTPPNRAAMPDADFDKWAKPEDIAEIIAFMGSASADILREPVMKVYADS